MNPFRHLRKGVLVLAPISAFLGCTIGTSLVLGLVLQRMLHSAPAAVAQPLDLYVVQQITNFPNFRELVDIASDVPLTAYARNQVTLLSGEYVHRVSAECVSRGYFRALRVDRPLLGTYLGDSASVGDEVVISYPFWRQTFLSSDGVIGRQLDLAGRSFTIVGVAAPEFVGIDTSATDVWLPLETSGQQCFLSSADALADTRSAWLTVVARTPDLADVTSLSLAADRVAKGKSEQQRTAIMQQERLKPLLAARLESGQRVREVTTWVFVGAIVVMAMVVCNCGLLMLAKTLAAAEELLLRSQLGMSRGHLAVDVIIEAVVTFVATAVVAAGFVEVIPAIVSRFFLLPPVLLPARSIGSAIGLAAIASAVGFVSLPCVVLRSAILNDNSRHWIAWVAQRRIKVMSCVVVVEIALSYGLIVATLLFARSLISIRAQLGFEPNRIIAVTADLVRENLPTSDLHEEFQLLKARIDAVPGIDATALASNVPMSSDVQFRILAGRRGRRSSALLDAVSSNYFSLTRTEIVKGRSFRMTDSATSESVAIVSDSFLRTLLVDDTDSIGRCIEVGPQPCVEIVGVSRARRHQLTQTTNELFVPWTQASRYLSSGSTATLLAHFVGNKRDVTAQIAALTRMGRLGGSTKIVYVSDLYDEKSLTWRAGAVMFALYGAITILLTATGVWGVCSVVLRQRRREIGIRRALGAEPRAIAALLLRDWILFASVGISAGAMTVYALQRVVQRELYGVTATDPLSLVGGALLLLAAVACAFLMPLRSVFKSELASELRSL